MKRIAVIFSLFIIYGSSFIDDSCRAQTHIAAVRPDRAAPGMNVVIEVMTNAGDIERPFGFDSLYDNPALGDSVILVNRQDSDRVVFGPPEVSWNGRLIQIPLIVLPNASLGPLLFYIKSTTGAVSDIIDFVIDSVQHLGIIARDTTIGGGTFGQLSPGNTIIVDSLIVKNSTVHFSLEGDTDIAGNPRFQPVTVLSKGPVRLTNATISVNAIGINGGPGGGGGGHGFPGAGGNGFTGGGSCPSDSVANNGSDTASTLAAGGSSITGIVGGGSDPSDQGGGGGTGAPFAVSGSAGVGSAPSLAGGFGGGSGGGELALPLFEYGGGGGGFGTVGIGGGDLFGNGANGGKVNDGRFLMPLAGGSGGGAGNANNVSGSGGSGGGGGGAIAIIAFDSIVFNNPVNNSVTIAARGDSGTSGIGLAAGGGGGSGGAIYVASSKGIKALNPQTAVDVNGGLPGLSGDSENFGGGKGGEGRIRVDGPTNLVPNTLNESVWTRGISITPTGNVPAHGFVQITGVASDTTNTLDSIRIYYRTRHTAWTYIDTVRGSNGSWSKWLQLSHDSLLFVVALVMVDNPQSDRTNNDFEPGWLMSHAGIAIVRHQASPFLVALDTLNFGTVRLSQCKTLTLKVENEGEEPLVLSNGQVIGSTDFTIVSNSPITIQPYTFAEIQVQFCPDSSHAETDTLSISSNDSIDSTKKVTLLGTGLKRNDSLLISKANINFGRVLIGECASDTIILTSVGADSLYLDSSFWNDPPFRMKIISISGHSDTALKNGEIRKLVITFCPTDTGESNLTQILDGREDSIEIEGYGVRRRAASKGDVDLGIICLGHTVVFVDTITIKGNDTMTLESIAFPGIDTIKVDKLLQPVQKYPVSISFTPDSVGSVNKTITYSLPDTMLNTILTYHVAGAMLKYDSVSLFPVECVGGNSADSISLTSSGSDTVFLSNFQLFSDTAFQRIDTQTIIQPLGNILIHLLFHPHDISQHFDTLRFTATSGGCDSTISIVLIARGIESGLAAEAVDFDSVAVGDCKLDSMLIQNPCGDQTVIDSVHISNTSFKPILLPDTIPSDGSAYLYFKFCPLVAGNDSDTVILYPNDVASFTAVLKGIGYNHAAPSAYFSISKDLLVQAGSPANITLTLDSSSLTGKHDIHAALVFDPEVLSLNNGFQIDVHQASPGSDTFSYYNLNFSVPNQKIGIITWNTLVGPKTSTAIGLVLTADTFLNVIVNAGEVSVTDCFGLDGNLSPGGSYTFGPVNPDPAFDRATATIVLGNDGYVEAKIYDMTGRPVKTILEQNFQRGTYLLDIPTDGLSSGRYMIVVSSLGWRAAKPFIIDR